MASISIKSVTPVTPVTPVTATSRIKVKSMRINLFAAINNNNNNNNIHDIINNTISIDTYESHISDDVDDGASEEGDEKKSGYYYKNRERKLEYQKKYNKEQGDKIKNYNKDYYQKRREEILEKAKTKIICECGCDVQLFNMNSHKKTKKHLRALDAVKASKNCESV